MRAFVCCAVWSCHLWFAVALHALCQAIWARTAVGPRCPRVAGGARSRADRLPWIHQLVKDFDQKSQQKQDSDWIGGVAGSPDLACTVVWASSRAWVAGSPDLACTA